MLIGFETQTHETKAHPTGIPRVIRETHEWASDFFGLRGHQVGWVNTVSSPRSYNFTVDPYLRSDPVLNGPEAKLEECDALVILDISLQLNIAEVIHHKEFRGLKVYVLIHDLLPLTFHEWFPPGSQTPFRLYLQRMIHIADQIVVTSQHVASELSSLGWNIRAPIHIIPLGSIHKQLPPSQVPNDQISLLCVATVEPRKGHQRLLDAFTFIRAMGLDINLTFVGKKGWAPPELYSNIERHSDFGGRLRWLENANDFEVRLLATKSSIGVIPADGEGFGMFLEEALTLGLKVVASDIPVFREREQPNVFYANQDSESLAEAIVLASQTPWVNLPGARIRSMQDFARGFSDLILLTLEGNFSVSLTPAKGH